MTIFYEADSHALVVYCQKQDVNFENPKQPVGSIHTELPFSFRCKQACYQLSCDTFLKNDFKKEPLNPSVTASSLGLSKKSGCKMCEVYGLLF